MFVDTQIKTIFIITQISNSRLLILDEWEGRDEGKKINEVV